MGGKRVELLQLSRILFPLQQSVVHRTSLDAESRK